MRSHALLGASSSKRWLTCTPSARLEEQFENTTSSFAEEGTLAHSLAELKARYFILKSLLKEDYDDELAKIVAKADAAWDMRQMHDATDQYIDILTERLAEAKTRSSDAVLMLETKLDFSEYVPEGFGTADATIVADGRMDVIDFKYGKGVMVSAEDNSQGRLYAVGALKKLGFLYNITDVSVTIIQPRLDSISTDVMITDALLDWAEYYVKPRADLAYKGEGDFVVGEHCRFCRAKATCRTRAEEALSITAHDFEQPPVLSDDEIPSILAILDKAEAWIKDIREYAYEKALAGKHWDGFKIVEGRSNRVYVDEGVVSERLLKSGLSEDEIYDMKLKGVTAMEKLLGKKQFEAVLGTLVIKPQGKPTLVPDSDKREAVNTELKKLLED